MTKGITSFHSYTSILLCPLIIHSKFYKGILWTWRPDVLIKNRPDIKKYFIVISTKAWKGWWYTSFEDIHALTVNSDVESFKKEFPKGEYVVLNDADFISSDSFYPIDIEKEYDIIFVSRMVPNKRHELLIKILYILRDEYYRNVKALVVVGFGHKSLRISDFFENPLSLKQTYRSIKNGLYVLIVKTLYKRAIKNGLDIALITDHQGKKALRTLYNKSKMYLLLSKWEGRNRAAKEAMLCNIPVMTIKNNPTSEAYVNNCTGKAVEDSPRVVAREIVDMLDNYKYYSPEMWVLKHHPRHKNCKILWEKINSIEKYPGYPDIEAASKIRSQFTNNKYDNYIDLNNYMGHINKEGLSNVEIARIREEFGKFA